MSSEIKENCQYRNLFVELVRKGIRLKYRRSYLGIVWSMVEPLLTMIVLTLVFGTLFGNNDRTFPVYILAGRLIYSLFSQSTTTALKSIRQNESLIKKVFVPKILYPISGVVFNYILFMISLMVLLGVSLVLRVYPTIKILFAIVPLVTLFILSVGVGLILTTLATFFRDVEYLWNVGLMLVMYACAIFYYPEVILASKVSWILAYNPLFCIISNFRCCIFGEAMDVGMTVYSIVFAIISLLIGMIIFRKNEDKFILHL